MAAGETFGLLGPNGSGKTTTVRILVTLLRPTSGRATVGGFDVARAPERVRSVMGYAGQFVGVDDDLTALENLALQGIVLGIAAAMGASDQTGAGGIALVAASAVAFGVIWGCLSNLIALRTRHAELTMVVGFFLTLRFCSCPRRSFPSASSPAGYERSLTPIRPPM